MQFDLNARVNWLKRAARELSLVRLGTYLGETNLKIKPQAQVDAYTHNMVMILVASTGLKLVFKAHFNSGEIIPWTSKIFNQEANSLKSSQVFDFVKEYCNLAAGALKHELELHGFEVGNSLPMISRGFDEIFFAPPDGKRTFSDQWVVYNDLAGILCSTYFEVQDFAAVSRLKEGDFLTTFASIGAVEEL
jgi:hypothetical protein